MVNGVQNGSAAPGPWIGARPGRLRPGGHRGWSFGRAGGFDRTRFGGENVRGPEIGRARTARRFPFIGSTPAGMASGTAAFVGHTSVRLIGSYTHHYQQIVAALPGTNPTASGNTGISHAWRFEQAEVLLGGAGTRQWTPAERLELIETGVVRGYNMHHINSQAAYPELTGDPNNIVPLTRQEHLEAHGGNWQNPTSGPLLDRHARLEDVKDGVIARTEVTALATAGIASFLIGVAYSWMSDREAGWGRHLGAGVRSAAVTGVVFGVALGATKLATRFGLSSSAVDNFMFGSALAAGVIIAGYSYYRAGYRGWRLAGEMAWMAAVAYGVGAASKAAVGLVASKGALVGSLGGPIGVVIGVSIALVVGFPMSWLMNKAREEVGRRMGRRHELARTFYDPRAYPAVHPA